MATLALPAPSSELLIPSDETIAAILSDTAPALEAPADALPAPLPPPTSNGNLLDVSGLVSKTVFLKTRFGTLGNSRKVSGSEVLDTDADKALLKVSKQLLDSPELDAIKKADAKMRTWLYNTCLPYDMGIQLLPVGLIENAQAKMSEYKAERAALVDAFVSAYPALCETAAAHLGSLYNPADYPSVDAIRAKFVFEWQYISFGVPGQLKGISSALFEAEKEKQAAQLQGAAEEITALMRETLYEMVSHLEERLTPGDDGKPRILRESAVKNLTDFLDTFELRNVTDDKELSAQVAKVRELLSGTSAATLRSSDMFREKIRAGMAKVTESLSGMVEEKAGRHFRDE
jgi:hypothetical protein